MVETVEALERKRKQLYQRLASLADFRRGTLSVSYRKCGKKNCVCLRPGHPGHGPRYLWTTTTKGNRSLAKHLRLGPELEKAIQEESNYREFSRLTQELVEVNEKICELRLVSHVEDERELEALKKKQQRQFAAKRRKR